MERLSIVMICMLAFLACSCGEDSSRRPATVSVHGRTWTVELALTQDQRYRGLSDRPSLSENAGMLFVYPQPQTLEFCMRRCLISLDIAFLSADLRVVRMYTMPKEPYGQERATYPSVDRAQYALELNAGDLQKAGVKVGDRFEFSSAAEAAKGQPDGRR